MERIRERERERERERVGEGKRERKSCVHEETDENLSMKLSIYTVQTNYSMQIFHS